MSDTILIFLHYKPFFTVHLTCNSKPNVKIFFCIHRARFVVSLVLRVVMGKTVPRSVSATTEGPVTQQQANAIAAQVTQGNGK